MKRLLWGFLLSFLFLALFIRGALAQSTLPIQPRDPQFEQQIYDQLAKVNPQAVPLFKSATEALDQNNFEAAQAGYEKVLALVPNFPAALRRLGYVYAGLKQFDKAESSARRALVIDNSPDNQIGLANVLLQINTPKSNQEAFNLAKAALKLHPDLETQYMVILAGAATNDTNVIRETSAAILQSHPQDRVGLYYSGIIDAIDQKWEQSEQKLLLAQQNGMPADIIKDALDQGIRTQALVQRLIRWTLYGLAVWAALLTILFITGLLLSQMTSAAVNRQSGLTLAEISPAERLVRRIYRIVIAATSIYFYLSIPVMLLMVVGLVGGLIYSFIQSGSIPIKFTLMLVLFGLYTIVIILFSVFARRKDAAPGKELDRQEGFYLWQEITEIARKIGTRPVDTIFINPGTDIYVFERGSMLNKFRGKGQRCLVLGLGILPGMTLGQFRAILGHEYSHFNNSDTAGGNLSGRVSMSILTMASELASSGLARWYNPVWLFVKGYYSIFLRITQGASRLQEILADRFAAVQYGADNFISGLKFIVMQDLMFRKQVDLEVNQARTENRGLNNLYHLPMLDDCQDVDAAFVKIMEAKTSPYASHPSVKERINFVERIKLAPAANADNRPVMDLFSGADILQVEMTQQVEKSLRNMHILSSA